MDIWNVWQRVDGEHFPEHVAQYPTEAEAEDHSLRLMKATGNYDNYPGHIWYEKFEAEESHDD